MKALVIIAHDDDVVLWMGGTIRHLSEWHWHIVSMCNDFNKVRKNYFFDISERLGAKASAFDFRNYQNEKWNLIQGMKDSLKSVIGETHYDYVFTHSRDPNGEYGFHANHFEVCEVVRSLVNEGFLVGDESNLAYFCYSPIYGLPGLPTVAGLKANFYVRLSYSELAFKVKLIRLHQIEIVNNLENDLGAPCPNPEAFEGDNLNLPATFIRKSS